MFFGTGRLSLICKIGHFDIFKMAASDWLIMNKSCGTGFTGHVMGKECSLGLYDSRWYALTSYAFFAHNLPREAGATWFIPNQSITGSHLENVKMVNFAYQWESSRPKEHILPVKQWLRDFVYVLSGLFRNPRWPPSAILDFFTTGGQL